MHTVDTTATTPHQVESSCADVEPPPERRPLFPPRDADPETRRRWIASSPWPEVVFACAG